MSIRDIKTSLHTLIDDIDDEEMLAEIQFLIQSALQQDEGGWNKLSPEEKAAIEEGLAQAEEGKTITNAAFKERYKRWFSK